MCSTNSEEYRELIEEVIALKREGYNSPNPQIRCNLINENIYENNGKEHEKKLLQLCKEFYTIYCNNCNTSDMTPEEDIFSLPFKWKQNIKIIERRFNYKGMDVRKIYGLKLSKVSWQARLSLFQVIQNLKISNPRIYSVEVIEPKNICKEHEYADFEMGTDAKFVYTIIIELNNGIVYACNPFTNRTSKQYSQRSSRNEKSTIQKYYDEEKKGMLNYTFNALIGENGLNKNPEFPLDLYKVENIFNEILKEKLEINSVDCIILNAFSSIWKCKHNKEIKEKCYPSPRSEVQNELSDPSSMDIDNSYGSIDEMQNCYPSPHSEAQTKVSDPSSMDIDNSFDSVDKIQKCYPSPRSEAQTDISDTSSMNIDNSSTESKIMILEKAFEEFVEVEIDFYKKNPGIDKIGFELN